MKHSSLHIPYLVAGRGLALFLTLSIGFGQTARPTSPASQGPSPQASGTTSVSMAGPAQNHVLQLGATESSMVVLDHPSLNPTDAITIEFWCFPESDGNRNGRPVSKRDGSWGSYSINVLAGPAYCPDTEIGADLFTQGGGWGFPCSMGTTCAQWSHFAVVVDGVAGWARVYQDGVLAGICNVSPFSLVDSGDALRLGRTPGYSETQFVGSLDNVRVWTSARSQQEIEALMFVDISATDAYLYPDLGASWGFESGTDDATGINGGTLEGGAVIVQQDLPFDCNGNGEPDADDIANGSSLDCDGNGIPDECDLAKNAEADCNANGILDSCDIAAGVELDCNGNGIPDSCDLAAGTSLDCDANGIPDECDIVSGASDCNADGVPDACQITADATLDLNANGVLDSCEAIGTNYCSPAIANSTGAPAAILALGSEVVASSDLTMTVSGLPLNTFAMFVTSQTQGYAFPVPGSQGALCVAGFPGRFSRPGQIQSSGSSGSLVFPIDLTSLPTPIGFTAAQPGETWNFQAWYRDANPTVTSNFTDAVGITFQ